MRPGRARRNDRGSSSTTDRARHRAYTTSAESRTWRSDLASLPMRRSAPGQAKPYADARPTRYGGGSAPGELRGVRRIPRSRRARAAPRLSQGEAGHLFLGNELKSGFRQEYLTTPVLRAVPDWVVARQARVTNKPRGCNAAGLDQSTGPAQDWGEPGRTAAWYGTWPAPGKTSVGRFVGLEALGFGGGFTTARGARARGRAGSRFDNGDELAVDEVVVFRGVGRALVLLLHLMLLVK